MNNEIGVVAKWRDEQLPFAAVAELGLKVCQLVSWKEEHWTREMADRITQETQRLGIRMTALWAGWPGPRVWDLVQGPLTIGLVPPLYREQRVAALKKAGHFAQQLKLPAVITHLGFIPENPTDPLFDEVVEAVRHLAKYFQQLNLEFWFETGQETPVTLLRFIQAVGTSNLGINLDPANLILYGKGNPIDALDVFGTYVRNVHAKDGCYPTNPLKLGAEVKLGEGKVNFPSFIKRLERFGFKGEFIIEREISGEKQRLDIAEAIQYLRKLLS